MSRLFLFCSVLLFLSRPNITNMCKSRTAPQAENTILTSTSEVDSESAIAFNFEGSTGILVIFITALVVSFFLYQLCRCCMDGGCSSCSRQQRPNNDNQGSNNDNQGSNSAIIALAMAVGHQQNIIQQQQHQQQLDHQLQQPTRVTPGYSDSTVNQALLPTAPALQSTRPPGYSYSTLNQAILPTAPALQSTKPLPL